MKRKLQTYQKHYETVSELRSMHKTTNAQYNTPQPQLGKPQKKNRELRNRFTKYENHDINSINRNTPQSKKNAR